MIQEFVGLDTEASALPQSGCAASASGSTVMHAGGLEVLVSQWVRLIWFFKSEACSLFEHQQIQH